MNIIDKNFSMIEHLNECDESEIIVPIHHTIKDGVYCRIMVAPKDIIISGCTHLKGGIATLMEGTIQIIDGEKSYEISAPVVMTTDTGTQKIGRTLTDVVYMTCHNVNAGTVEEAEKELFLEVPQITRIRESYKDFLIENKLSQEDVDKYMGSNEIVKETQDNFFLGKSQIHGTGCFASKDYAIGDVIGCAVVGNTRMTLSRYMNHSDIPNCSTTYNEESIEIKAIKNISQNSELLLKYKIGE